MSSILIPCITLSTKINRCRNNIIDNIFTNYIPPDSITGNFVLNLSDGHLPSFFLIHKKNQNHIPHKQNQYKRETKNFDHENFILDFLYIDWQETLQLANSNLGYLLIYLAELSIRTPYTINI